MTRIELVNFYHALQEIKGTFSKYLYYSIEKTKANLKVEYEIIGKKEQELTRTPEIVAYENYRQQLVQQYCDKNEDGSPNIETKDGQTLYKMVENKEKFEESMKELTEINRPHLDKAQVNQFEFNRYLQEEVEVNVVKTSFKYLPDEINSAQIDILMKLINDEPVA